MEKPVFTLRPAKPGDETAIIELIRGIASYEHLEDQVVNTPEKVRRYLFEEKLISCLMVEDNGKTAGFALYFFNYSTFTGKPGLYLEDLFFFPEYRGMGGGSLVFRELARIALEKECGRMEWSCLNWNEPSLQFYRRLGAAQMREWVPHRLVEEDLRRIAEQP